MTIKTRKLMRENAQNKKKLPEVSQYYLDDVIEYLHGSGGTGEDESMPFFGISEYYRQVIIRVTTSMLLDGEKEGTPPWEIVGDDYKSYCNSMMEKVPKLSVFGKILQVLALLFYVASACLIAGIGIHALGCMEFEYPILWKILLVAAVVCIAFLISRKPFNVFSLSSLAYSAIISLAVCLGVCAYFDSNILGIFSTKSYILAAAAGILLLLLGIICENISEKKSGS